MIGVPAPQPRAFAFGRADAACRLGAAQSRHLQIHEDQIEGFFGGACRSAGGDRIVAVRHHDGTVAEPGEQAARQEGIDVVVFGDKDRKSRIRCSWLH